MKENESKISGKDDGTAAEKKPLIRKILKVFIILFIVVDVLLIGGIIYLKLPVSDYYSHSEKGFLIPDINDGFVAQGLAYDERSDCFFITGYMNDKTVSPIYMVEKESGVCIKTLKMQNPDGSEFYGHAGGMTVHGDYVYVAGSADHCLYVFSYADATKLNDGDFIKSIGTFMMPDEMSVAFVASDTDCLYSGEFYRAENYETEESHKMTTDAGDYNQALIFGYRFSDSDDAVFGLESEPFEAYSVTDLVQGMELKDGRIYLSTSYGVAFSHILVYDKPVSKKTYTLAGVTMPLYELDSASKVNDYKFAPMSEEIVFVDGKLYTMCESASNKYIFGKLTSARWCYATDMNWEQK